MSDNVAASAGRYRLFGGLGSPYSNKLRAIMRYRRIPHDWILRTARNRAETEHLRPNLVPILQYPDDGSYHIDSTPLAYELEARHPGQRSIIPDDPGHAFLCHLLEDMADEWLTKAMFHYRWAYAPDIEYASLWIADDAFPDCRGAERQAMARQFAERQISRMPLVGCTPENAPIIEASFHRILALLESRVGVYDYLFGSRPSLADFGIFGQLKPLATDPTPMAIMRREAMRTESWVRQLDDASGIEGEWLAADEDLPDATMGLLRVTADCYLPFLLANAAAAGRGEQTFTTELLGQPYGQATFGYQVKCLAELRRRLAALSGEPLARTRGVLEQAGCWQALTEESK
ncbi:MAG: glutathione S-transferase C-terminal domain-containing protein [Alphaproteobacteria bacterium]|jgi:glutathione S-transferase|nr:glutathione S-transferase C-terminal domain-containing protein [Alphaproteobacteria bacterium]MDP6566876.1 glutathione S-transferase C-terminal domain-containing protein [Alphaproteobacteria bacterium]MDP6815563.1 glutathione S-transferase C-terminal domain-containing protein [Alphaproteobacteria bacterium]